MPAIDNTTTILRLIKEVNYIRSILNRVTVNLPLFDVSNENSPDPLTADEDNYVVGNYDLLRLSSTTEVTITGLKGGIKGRFLRLFNVSSYAITLAYQDVSSDAENRFKFSNGLAAVIPPSSNTIVYYDATINRWIGGDTASSGSVFCNIKNTTPQAIPSGVLTQVDPGASILDQYSFYDGIDTIVIPFDGFYQILFQVTWDHPAAGNTSYPRELVIEANYFSGGAGNIGYSSISQAGGSWAMSQQAQSSGLLHAGDTVKFYALQNDAAAADLDITTVNVTLTRIS